MQPLYTEAEFETATSRQLLPLRCLHCTQTFFRTKHHIQTIISSQKATGCLCSKLCRNRYIHREKRKIVICEQCLEPFSKKRFQITSTKHNFCCKSCAAKWNNTHKKHGTRISKLERWLQEQLPILYPSLEFNFNRTDAINGELDIFIPSLKLAFELNGIFHYEPIYGAEKLAKMQTNDTRKSQACFERGIELCIIDVSTQKYFKKQSSMKFLNIIQNIINSRLSRSSPV
jgi:hypothetical protein